ncbi:hypothetical protein ID866_5314 [Astraeus odoratus]|nr:hypothetical protein ID866_5314 [Astraeus odoratus]
MLSETTESPTSPVQDDSDALLSPPETEPQPGIDGKAVRWYDADRTEPYTRIAPFQERSDTSVEFFYKPITLTALTVGLAALAYIAMTQDVLEEGRDKRRIGAYAALASFLMFSMIQFRDGPFIRPHPAFWRVVLGVNLLYELALVFLLFQDLDSARHMMTLLDTRLGVPLPEKSYAENCAVTASNIWRYVLQFKFGLVGSPAHRADSAGGIIGYLTFYFAIGLEPIWPYEWRGLRQTRGLRSKARRVLSQFSPHDWTAFKWEGTASFYHYTTVVLLLAVFLAAELNPFYLKSLLWMEPEHPIVILRLASVFLCALPAVRELYQYVNDPKKAKRMGQHCWLLLATILTEILVITKWSRGQFEAPLPQHVKWSWTIGGALLLLYPAVRFGVPGARRYLRRNKRKAKAKAA